MKGLKMKSSRLVLFALFLLILFARPAAAFTEGACKPDEEKYCKGKPMIGGELKKCMESHIDQLSDACKANILELMMKAKEKQAGNS